MRASAALLLVLCPLALSLAWNCKDIKLKNVNQIDAGLGQVVATDRYRHAYFLSGTSWLRLPSASLKHISVGPAGIWGINYRDYVYKYAYGTWMRVAGGLKQVDAGGAVIVGVNSAYYPLCLRSSTTIQYKGSGSVPWARMPGRIKYYSCGPYGCWGVNTASNAYLMRSVNPTNCRNTNWQYISGLKLAMVEVSTDGSVFGVTTSGQIYSRDGISAGRPQGIRWTSIPMCGRMPVKHVTYDLGRLWVVNRSSVGMVCTR